MRISRKVVKVPVNQFQVTFNLASGAIVEVLDMQTVKPVADATLRKEIVAEALRRKARRFQFSLPNDTTFDTD